ncbi:MAG TPA: cation:proton antiporter [Gemmatimonadales bacterium]|nr:cation:proton antiporter [Gemmatimonadales bacterium]
MTSHTDPIAFVALALAIILAGAKLGGHLAERIGQPAVLGELLVGIVLGNLHLVGIENFEPLKANTTLDALARLGVILLLFEVGLESTVGDMLQVGARSLAVAVLGVVAPWVLGWAVGVFMLPQHSVYAHVFLGAILTATSVGITARVLRDLGRAQAPEARIILGAAVIDDILGLVILAVVANLIGAANTGSALSWRAVSIVIGKAMVFLVGALSLGLWLSPHVFRLTARLRGRGILLATGLVFCFLLSWLASVIGLAPIVGAFAAGLVLEQGHYRQFTEKGEHTLVELVKPIASFLVPVFFVLVGMTVEIAAFANRSVLGLATLLTVAAIVGKQLCALGGLGAPLDRLSIGIGMIPRGEVGLIFANIGLGLAINGVPVIDRGIYSAVVIMVMLTTLVTPPLLQWSLARGEARTR